MYKFDKILIVRFSSIGDIILTSPLIRVLRKAFPQSQIDFLIRKEYSELIKFNPYLSNIITLENNKLDELDKLHKKIQDTRYDLLVDLHNSLRSRYLRYYSYAKNVVVIDKRVIFRFIYVHLKWNLYRDVISVANRYLETVKKYGIENDDRGLEVFFPDEVQVAVNSILSKEHLERYNTIVGIIPSAKHFTKRWLPERFVELGDKINDLYKAKILIFGGKDDKEYCSDIAQMINQKKASSVAVSYGGELSLLETAAAFDRCNLIVSNDTGGMHLAAARKRKVIAIFGSSVPEFGFFPYGTDSLVVSRHGLPCRPCSHIGLSRCPKKHFKCMKEISVDQVLSSVQVLMKVN